jgi:16S rRNA C967 or C1407 C5-methylase (RsmB/RsmF family)/NOL1/NOP2/fmu family ribosome biogenesis protein
MQDILGQEYGAFAAVLDTVPPVSIRLNPAKIPEARAALPPASAQVPWHPQGFYLHERPIFTLDPLLHAGAYYVQEASSMFLYEAVRQSIDVSKSLNVLDLCASPGGKSTLLADFLNDRSLLVANDAIRTRTAGLRENLERWGFPNTAVTAAEASDFGKLEGFFDLIVVDAPCSGEGLFRKDPNAVGEWSPAHVDFCRGRQRRILADVLPALAPGGVLVYSTCTYNRAENEENVQWLLQHFDLEKTDLSIPADWNIEATEGGYRFFPHKVQGEGFFIGVLRNKQTDKPQTIGGNGFKSIIPLAKAQHIPAKKWLASGADLAFFNTPGGEVLALNAALIPAYAALDKYLKTKWFGVFAGAFKGTDFIPAHPLALSRWAPLDLPALELEREQALLYLKKENFDAAETAEKGWALARYKGLNLGWMKILPGRINNYLPVERRIRMDLRR